MATPQRTSYDIAADDLVAVLYKNKLEYEKIRFEYGLLPNFMPLGFHRQFTEAVYWLYSNDKPIHDTTILERAPAITSQWLAERVTLYDNTRIGHVTKENVTIVKDEGLHRGTVSILNTAREQMIAQGASGRKKNIQRLTSMLGSIGTDMMVKDVSAASHGKKNRIAHARIADGAKIGIPFLDNNIGGGYEKGHIWWIGGAYKGRKTTLGLNMALGLALSGQMSPAILSGEMQQERVQRQLEAMLAIAWIKNKGFYGQTFKSKHTGVDVGYDWIDVNVIKKVDKAYAELPDDARLAAFCNFLGDVRGNALYWAQETYDTLDLRIYDATAAHGGLSNYEAVDMAINMDMMNYGGNWFMLDYLQMFSSGVLFEDMQRMSKALQQKAISKNILMLVLAQLNESTINSNEGYSAGTKGGGDAAATADIFLRTKYQDEKHSTNEKEIDIQVKFNRHGSGSNGLREVHDVHPKSGLILSQTWIEGLDI